MATGTAGTVARSYHTRQVAYLEQNITSADAASTAITIGVIPAGAAVVRCGAVVHTAFNAGTLNSVAIGTASTAAAYTSTLTISSVGVKFDTVLSTAAGAEINPQVDTTVTYTRTQTGNAASAGAAVVWVEYLEPGIR